MIADALVLNAEFIPIDVVHRDAEINLLSSVPRPVTTGDSTDPAFLHGPSGTWTTCISPAEEQRPLRKPNRLKDT